MLKFLKWVLITLGISGVVVVILCLTLNLNSFRGRIEAEATDILELPTQIKGDIKFSILGWRPALAMKDVTVSSKESVIKADSVAVTPLSLKPPQRYLSRINGLTVAGHLLGNYDVPVVVYETGFDCRGVSGELEGAALEGDVSYLDDKFTLNLALKDIPYRRLCEGAEGKVRGKIKLTGIGADIAQVMRTLDGNFTLIGSAGKLNSKSINSWTRGLLSTIFSMQNDETKLNCMLADFKIKDGVARTGAIVVDTDEVSIFGKGSIDLNRRYVDITLRPEPKDMSLVSVATPVRMSGPVNNVDVSPVGEAVIKKIGGLLLGAVNPAMAFLPLIELGAEDSDNPCLKSSRKKPAL